MKEAEMSRIRQERLVKIPGDSLSGHAGTLLPEDDDDNVDDGSI
jgi:hypothetical protein